MQEQYNHRVENQLWGKDEPIGNQTILSCSHYHLLSCKWARFTREQWIDAQENEAGIMDYEMIGVTVELEDSSKYLKYSPICKN